MKWNKRYTIKDMKSGDSKDYKVGGKLITIYCKYVEAAGLRFTVAKNNGERIIIGYPSKYMSAKEIERELR